jgi:hypothetical protein
MHRSGTSLLGSILQALGVTMPGPLIEGDQHNPNGYFERVEITDLQDRLLIDLGQWWPSEAGVLERPANWLQRPATRRTATSLRQLLEAELARQTEPWGIKDPRTSLLLPLWRQVAAELEIPLRLVLSVRNPAEVMVSLLQRDSGITPWRAQRLWWRHNRELLLDAAPSEGAELPLLVVDYAAWFDPVARDRQLQGLARFCRATTATSAEMAAAVAAIRPELRRSQRTAEALPLAIHPRLTRLHRRLQHLARHANSSSERPSRRVRQLLRWLTSAVENRLPVVPPPRPSTLRASLIYWRASLVPQVEVGPWFDPAHYRRQVPGLPDDHDPINQYWWQGWREERSPHPFFDGPYYRKACRDRGLAVNEAPLLHFLRLGLDQNIPPSQLAETNWKVDVSSRRDLWRASRLEGLHPWGAAALALSDHDPERAVARLRQWQQQGFNANELATIESANPSSFHLTKGLLPEPPSIPTRCRVMALGSDLCNWQIHAWLQYCPLPEGFELLEDGDLTNEECVMALVLQPQQLQAEGLQLLGLAQLECVFARSDLVELLRRLGVNAQPIDSAQPAKS